MSKKKYSSEEKFRYHNDRYFSCGKYGLEFGGSKHCYSTGFRDAFKGRDNVGGIQSEFGKKKARAYALGFKRGRNAAYEYLKRTEKQPFSLN